MHQDNKHSKTTNWVTGFGTAILIVLLCAITIFLYLKWSEKKQGMAGMADAYNESMLSENENSSENQNPKLTAIYTALDTYLPGIVTWGDGLTSGSGGGGTSYPQVLEETIEKKLLAPAGLDEETFTVVNMGSAKENSATVVGRTGAIPFVLVNSIEIPADKTPVSLQLVSQDGQSVSPLRDSSNPGGADNVTIDGIEGTLKLETEDPATDTYSYSFTRNKAGKEQKVEAGATVIPTSSDDYKNLIPVIFIGQNGGYDNLQELGDQIQAIIDNQEDALRDRYIVLGATNGNAWNSSDLETYLAGRFGDHYINLRNYLATDGMTDAGLQITIEDQNAMSQGIVPPSLKSSELLLNATSYSLIGKQVYNRMNELGYFQEVQDAIQKASETE